MDLGERGEERLVDGYPLADASPHFVDGTSRHVEDPEELLEVHQMHDLPSRVPHRIKGDLLHPDQAGTRM